MDFFCFKPKTAYEMRISDWSSDVCSSDLGAQGGLQGTVRRLERACRQGMRTFTRQDTRLSAAYRHQYSHQLGRYGVIVLHVSTRARWPPAKPSGRGL